MMTEGRREAASFGRRAERAAVCATLGVAVGVLGALTQLDYLLAAVGSFWLGIVWLPILALVAVVVAYRSGSLLSVVLFAGVAATANYVTNLLSLPNQLMPHAWVYALFMCFASIIAATLIMRLVARPPSAR